MELNKFEKKLKKDLGRRQITPSAKSWGKLEAKLDAEDNKTTLNPWKYIVAVVAVLLIAGSLTWRLDYSETPQVVEKPVKENIEKPLLKQQKPVIETQIASEETRLKERTSVDNETSNLKTGLVTKEDTRSLPISEEKSSAKVVVLETINLEPPILKQEIVKTKIEEVIAAAKNKEKITNDEVDALLAEAAAQISRERNLKITGENEAISANALLAEVEDELYQSFKARVFEILKEGYLKAKTAVANSN